MESERHFSITVSKDIKTFMEPEGFPSVKVRERVNILNSFTIGKIESGWKLTLGGLQQDIVLYQNEMDIAYLRMDKSIIIPRGMPDCKLIIPLVVCELKINANLNTHQLITYSHIARDIKSVFPFCAYYLVCSGGGRRFGTSTIMRHTKEFNRVFLDWERDKKTVRADLFSHLNYLKRLGLVE